MRSDGGNANGAFQLVGRRDILKTAGVGAAMMTLGAPASGQARSGPGATRGRIRQYKDYIGHYHTAGNPGRCEIGDRQEINYKPIMEEIVRTGYTGYVGQEFVPTGDPLESFRQAVALCDV